MNRSILSLALLLISIPCTAYIGPGMSGGVIAAFLGFFAAILLGIWGILYLSLIHI